MKKALAAAERELESETATQEEVNAATDALRKALEELSKNIIDKAGLNAAITRANGINAADYANKPDKWKAVQDALEAAKKAQENADASQTEIDTAVRQLNEAIRQLDPDTVHKVALGVAIERAKNRNADDYRKSSWKAMQDALAAAEKAQQSETVTQAEVNAATDALRKALEELDQNIIDKAGLNAAIIRANGRNKEDYTEASWKVMQDALAEGKKVAENGDAAQEEIDKATKALSEALRNLKETDQGETDLNSALKEAKSLKKDDYTPKAWEVFQKALSVAEAVLQNPDATKEQKEEAAVSLKKAMEEVKQNPAKEDKDPGNQNTQPVKVKKITISGISKKIAAGQKIRLTAKVTPSNAANKNVTWKSGDKKVATVSSSGIVSVKKNAGGKKVTITATAKDGSKVKAAYRISVVKGKVKKVSISGKKSVKAGKTLKLKAKVTAEKRANKKIKWISSNTNYATVSSSGKVKAKKAGKNKKIKITAMATDGTGKKKTVTIKIK